MDTISGIKFTIIRSIEPPFKIQIDIFKALKEISAFCKNPFIFDATKKNDKEQCVIVSSSQITELEAQAILQNS